MPRFSGDEFHAQTEIEEEFYESEEDDNFLDSHGLFDVDSDEENQELQEKLEREARRKLAQERYKREEKEAERLYQDQLRYQKVRDEKRMAAKEKADAEYLRQVQEQTANEIQRAADAAEMIRNAELNDRKEEEEANKRAGLRAAQFEAERIKELADRAEALEALRANKRATEERDAAELDRVNLENEKARREATERVEEERMKTSRMKQAEQKKMQEDEERKKRQEDEERNQRMREQERTRENELRRQRRDQSAIDLEFEEQEKARMFRDRSGATRPHPNVTKNHDFNKDCAAKRKAQVAEKKENRRIEANARRRSVVAPYQSVDPNHLPQLPSSSDEDSEMPSDDSVFYDKNTAYGGGEHDDSYISLDDYFNKESGESDEMQKTKNSKNVRL